MELQTPAEVGVTRHQVIHGPLHATRWLGCHEYLEGMIIIEHPDHVQEDLAHLAHLLCIACLGSLTECAARLVRSDHLLGGQVAGLDGQHHAGGENGIDESSGIPDEQPAWAGILKVAVGVIPGKGVVTHPLGIRHALLQFRGIRNHIFETRFRAEAGGLEMLQRLHEADGGFFRIKRDHPEPAEIQPDDGNVALGGRIIPFHSFEMGESGEFLWQPQICFRQFHLLAQKGIPATGIEDPS